MISWYEYLRNVTPTLTANDNERTFWAAEGPITPTAGETIADVKNRCLRVAESLTGTNSDMELKYLSTKLAKTGTLSDLRSAQANI